MTCDQHNFVQLHHDGELTPREELEFQSHLRTCSQCTQELAQLQGVSRLLDEAPLVQPLPMTIQRLRRVLRNNREQSVRRLSGWLTAAAAAVLALSFAVPDLTPAQSNSSAAATDFSPVDQFVMLSGGDGSVPDSLVVADWMASDLAEMSRVQP
ncbi:MAG: zf-HC2 domain-containing protein [Phycisphaerales bacterium]|nr:zf-HC2 domain-containing protein [Phycisphaerales bacterium]